MYEEKLIGFAYFTIAFITLGMLTGACFIHRPTCSNSLIEYPPTRVTTFVMTESETHRRLRHVGEFQLKIEFQKPAHCVKYMYSATYLTTWDPTRRAASRRDIRTLGACTLNVRRRTYRFCYFYDDVPGPRDVDGCMSHASN